jgi:integrase
METNTKPRGWHAARQDAPCKGVGSATVDPFRTRKEINAIKGVLATKPRDYALFVVGIHVGLRGSDLLALRWKDVAAPNGQILREFAVTESKTGKRRALMLQDNAREALRRWQQAAPPSGPDALVFPGISGRPLSIQRLHQLINGWAEAASVVGHFGTHSLRKTYGCHLRIAGVGIEILMKVFGHSSQSTTLRYIGLRDVEIDEANLKLSL